MSEYAIEPLGAATWDAFASLAAEKHNGVWGGCSGSFLDNGTRSLFEQAGFRYERPKGKSHCVMRTTVSPLEARA